MQLESTEAYLMNVCNCLNAKYNTGIPSNTNRRCIRNCTIYSHNQWTLPAPVNGDTTYTVSTTITSVPPTSNFSVVVTCSMDS